MTQQVTELVTDITPPEPPPRVPSDTADSPTLASKWSRKESPMIAPSTSIAVPPSSSRAHRRTLEYITEVVQELYTKGQLHVKPYAGYLKGKHMQSHTQDSPLQNVEHSLMMHIYKGYSHPSVCDYLDTESCLAIDLLTVIHRLLTHSFKSPMTMDFNSMDTLLADFVLMETSEFL